MPYKNPKEYNRYMQKYRKDHPEKARDHRERKKAEIDALKRKLKFYERTFGVFQYEVV
jgi:hypothetical protein